MACAGDVVCASKERKEGVMNVYFLAGISLVFLWGCAGLCSSIIQMNWLIKPWRARIDDWAEHAAVVPKLGSACKEWEDTNSIYHGICLEYARIAVILRQGRLLLIEWRILSRDIRRALASLKETCIE